MFNQLVTNTVKRKGVTMRHMGKIDLSTPINQLTEKIIGAAIEVHKHLGPGLLESAYEACLHHELTQSGLQVTRQTPISINYKGLKLNHVYRLDLLVENQVIIEIKTVEELTKTHEAQILSYLRFTGYPVGLLINFHTRLLREGIRRYAK
jgi:GxxExxY protein